MKALQRSMWPVWVVAVLAVGLLLSRAHGQVVIGGGGGSVTSNKVVTALGYTPMANTSNAVVTALGYVPGIAVVTNITCATNSAWINITNIPQQYGWVELDVMGSVTGASETNVFLQFNGDTNAVYCHSGFYTFGQTAGGSAGLQAGNGYTNNTYISFIPLMARSNTVGFVGAGTARFRGYATPNSFRMVTMESLSYTGLDLQKHVHWFRDGMYPFTNAITSILVYPMGGSFMAGTRATLRGSVLP